METQNRIKINQHPIHIVLFYSRLFKVKDICFKYRSGKKRILSCGGKMKRYSNSSIFYILSDVNFEKTQLSQLDFTIYIAKFKTEIRMKIYFVGVKPYQYIEISSYYLNLAFEVFKLPIRTPALAYQPFCEYFTLHRQYGLVNRELVAQKNSKNMALFETLDLYEIYEYLCLEHKSDYNYFYESYKLNYFLGKNKT